ncbi:hypothetical protein J3458_001903 [Metarhizium acridum]|uniref:uncharacterized protein n=1 Tax=Metarhizium acridum TaxID=92637 RepID=UPI001C6AEF92|nr:hypothetical protein J3458_001903 [Metarhizium acridum]
MADFERCGMDRIEQARLSVSTRVFKLGSGSFKTARFVMLFGTRIMLSIDIGCVERFVIEPGASPGPDSCPDLAKDASMNTLQMIASSFVGFSIPSTPDYDWTGLASELCRLPIYSPRRFLAAIQVHLCNHDHVTQHY